jgi:hypothetical protein
MRLNGKWLWIGLEIIGGLAIVLMGCIGWSVWELGHDHEKTNQLKPKEAGFLLDWGGVKNTAKVGRFVYSKVSSRSFTGDHADFYVLEMGNFSKESALKGGLWQEGPLHDPTLEKAVDFSMCWGDESYPGFPSREGLSNRHFLFSFPWIYLHGQRVTAAIVMIYDPETRRLYVVDSKT